MNDSNIRGVEHVGITVPDLDEATEFLEKALGAVVVYDVLSEPLGGKELEDGLGLPEGTIITFARMMRIGNGANFEVFGYEVGDQRPPHRPCDLGWQHVAFQVEDIFAATERFLAAGGEKLADPMDLPGGAAGKDNYFVYLRAPWGTTFEFISFPGREAYEETTDERCWRPPVTS